MGEKILVVEDNELNLKLFCDLLRAHGYEAEPVREGLEAMERARAFLPDLIIMDIQMPNISGLDLIEQLKGDEELRRVPIMAVTAYAAKGDEERIRDAGAEGYVSKPISVARFVEAVRALLAAPAQSEAEAPEEDGQPLPREPEQEVPEPEEDRHSREMMGPPLPRPGDGAAPSWNPEGGGDGEVEEEEKVDPGLRRDDAGPKGETP